MCLMAYVLSGIKSINDRRNCGVAVMTAAHRRNRLTRMRRHDGGSMCGGRNRGPVVGIRIIIR